MRRRQRIRFPSVIDAGTWSRRGIFIAAIVAMAFLPSNVSNAGWLSDLVKGKSTQVKSPKHVTAPKPRAAKAPTVKPVALKPAHLAPIATKCDPAKFRIVLDVGH